MNGRGMYRLILIILLTGAISAQKSRRIKKPKQKGQIEQGTVTPAPQTGANTQDAEMAAARAIQVRSRATYADLCRIVLLQRGEFSRYKTDAERCEYVASLGRISINGIDPYTTPVPLGITVKSAIYAHSLERSFMLRVTGWSWYALQSAEALGLVQEGMSAADEISGAELMQIMDEAMNLADEAKDWNKPENPYQEFGHETYEEMYQNPVGPAKTK